MNFFSVSEMRMISMASAGQSLTQILQPMHLGGLKTTLPRKSLNTGVFSKGYWTVAGFLNRLRSSSGKNGVILMLMIPSP